LITKQIDEYVSVVSFVFCYFTAVSKQQEESAARKGLDYETVFIDGWYIICLEAVGLTLLLCQSNK
jgi:hypothetical protein